MHRKTKDYLKAVIERPGMHFGPSNPEALEHQLFGIAYALNEKRERSANAVLTKYIEDHWNVSTCRGWAEALKLKYPRKTDYTSAVIKLIGDALNIKGPNPAASVDVPTASNAKRTRSRRRATEPQC